MRNEAKGWVERWQIKYAGWQVHSLARASFWGDKFNQRFSVLGMSLVAALLVTLIFGMNIKQTMIYQLFSLLLCLFVLSIVVMRLQSFRKQKKFDISRSMAGFATVDVPFSYRINIKNRVVSDAFNLRVAERSKPSLPSRHQFLFMTEPDEEKRNVYDRKMGFYRFAWLVHWLRGGILRPAFVSKLQAGKTVHLDMTFTPLRRGYMHFSNVRVSIAEPLGLLYRFQDYELPQSLLILPKRYVIPRQISLAGRSSYQKNGLSLASNVGEPEEFSRMREYRVGDSPRHIHWPSLARAGKTLVKEFQDENFARQALVLDNFADENKSQAFEEAVSLAAGFAMSVESDDALLDLMFVGDKQHVEDVVVGRALAHGEQMLEALASLEACTDDGFESLTKMIIAQSGRFGSCVLVLLDWDEPRQSLVHQLTTLSIPVRVFLIQPELAEEPGLSSVADIENFHPLKVGQIQKDLDALNAS